MWKIMDDSWQMRMGTAPGPPLLHHRRSTETSSSSPAVAGPTRRSVDNHRLDPNNFADVFGGPPRSLLARKFSGDLNRPSGSFYEEVFRPPSFACPPAAASKNGGRCLPAFRIPAKGEGFYSDVFGAEEDGRASRERSRPNSKGKSKSNSSSVLSSEELSPRRPNVSGGHDPALSSFASKLRSINVPARWNSTTMKPAGEERLQTNKQEAPSFPYNRPSYAAATAADDSFMEKQQLHANLKSCVENYFKAQQQQQQFNSSPETTTVEPNTSYWSTTCRGSGDDNDDDDDDVELEEMNNNSPVSPAASSVLCQLDPEPACSCTPCDEQYHNDVMREIDDDEEEEEEEEEVMSNSYVIEINNCDYNNRDGEAVSIDEAIAWAKEKFRAHTEKEALKDAEFHQSSSMEEADGGDKWVTTTEEEKSESERDREIEELKEEIRLWSSGKQNNIRLLLSSLHHILEPGSGWSAIPLTSIITSSQVKKAYQRARLCLHPDKLQQRGATQHHKYVAEQAFAILQDAWAAFISQDLLFNNPVK
ncbi:unnamed protein product [Linum tenue]|uniref:Uncharacterized protein n=1 Tax=Linum tenue TaxID=586396 RepID=A0AAV0QL53_9ROSI|nr:unnamed protein product [Linum tenue]